MHFDTLCIFIFCFIKLISFTYFQNYETTESRIKREFEAYGPIKRVGYVEYPEKGLNVIPFCSVRGLALWYPHTVVCEKTSQINNQDYY